MSSKNLDLAIKKVDESGKVNFNTLSWAGLCFYYRSVGDRRYSKVMGDAAFLTRLRREPAGIGVREFEEKVILDHVKIENYDLLIRHNLAGQVLAQIIKLQPVISPLLDIHILDCDLSESDTIARINIIYLSLCSVNGLWLTGVSKILHVLNEKLFAILNLDIATSFGLAEGEARLVEWLRLMQQNAKEVMIDFREQGFPGSPEAFLSEKLGYSIYGYEKSLVKFLDEYFWLRYGDDLPVPPRWVPPHISDQGQA